MTLRAFFAEALRLYREMFPEARCPHLGVRIYDETNDRRELRLSAPGEAVGADDADITSPGVKPPVDEDTPIPLREIERKILSVATSTPQTAKTLARLAGYKTGSYFSAALTRMCRCGLLVRCPDGYKKP